MPRHCGEPMAGVEITEVYDGVLFFQCDRCNGVVQRWPKGTQRREKSEAITLDHGFVDVIPEGLTERSPS